MVSNTVLITFFAYFSALLICIQATPTPPVNTTQTSSSNSSSAGSTQTSSYQTVPIPYQADGLNCTVSTGSSATATYSDCEALLQNSGSELRSVWSTKETCAYITDPGFERAASSRVVGCHGNCCLSFASPAKTPQDQVKINEQDVIRRAQGLLKCGQNAGSNEISARRLYQDGTGLCLLKGNSTCGCFDDLLWTPYGAPVDNPTK